MKRWWARAAYSTLVTLLAPWLVLRLWRRARAEPLYGQHIGERYGLYRRSEAPFDVWLHAVSLGETRAAEPLVQALRERRPGLRLLLTHSTATGRTAGATLLRPGDAQAWLPFDTPGAVRRFLRHFQPRIGVLMETEVWPNLVAGCRSAGVPLVVANARLSPKSLRQSLRFDALLRPAAAGLTDVLAQTEADAQRMREAGARTVQVMGNLKFDLAIDPAAQALGQRWRAASTRPVVAAAVWREGEDGPLLQAWNALLPAERPRLLLVPRHPQRFDEVAALVAQTGLSLSRRSAWPGGAPDAAALAADVWLGDSMREMAAYYTLADVALLGGSFAPLGGQNLIEAAACGRCVVMGPHTFNFADAAERAEEAGAALRVPDLPAAVRAAIGLLDDVPERERREQAALTFAAAHRGAATRMAEAVLARLPVTSPVPGRLRAPAGR
jgi:3-deoxy-D-manno-octulosonic-acid transferase